jgi:hypothetical protein
MMNLPYRESDYYADERAAGGPTDEDMVELFGTADEYSASLAAGLAMKYRLFGFSCGI